MSQYGASATRSTAGRTTRSWPTTTGRRARAGAGGRRPGAGRRGQGERDRLVRSVPFRVRDVVGKTYPLPAGDVPLGPKLRVAVDGTPTELAGPSCSCPARRRSSSTGAYRGQIAVSVTGQKLRRGQRRRPRGLPPGRRAAEMPSALAGRGAEGAGRRGALLRARAPAERQGVRPLRRHAQPGLRRDRRRDAATTAAVAGDEGRGAALRGQADRRVLLTRPRAARRSTRRRSSARPCRTSSPSTTPTDALSPVHRWGPVAVTEAALAQGPQAPGCR